VLRHGEGGGVSVNSKAGLDLDAASQLNSFSTLNSHDNTRSSVRVLTGSTLTLGNQARVISTQNANLGLVADNGAGLTLVNSTLTGNASSDLHLTFGTRADVGRPPSAPTPAMPPSSCVARAASPVRTRTVDESASPTRKEVVNRRLRG